MTGILMAVWMVLLGTANPATPGLKVDLGKVGTVALPNSCATAVQEDFQRAAALLHSFFYEEARLVFTEVASRDPRCAMAHWGIAMSYYHPIWAPPHPEDYPPAIAAVDRAAGLKAAPGIEQGLIAAARAYWRPAPVAAGKGQASSQGVPSCHGGAPSPGGSAAAFRGAMQQLHSQFPRDVEVASFYALALLGTAPKEDRTLSQQKEAAGLLEAMWKEHPNHPGIVHYLIHAYDYPETAKLGLPAARAYAGVAPQVPHALHMPSHIFSRLGMWPDEETSNLASVTAAARWTAVRHPGETSFDAMHASDYLTYGYLQQGRFGEAEAQVRWMANVGKVIAPHEIAGAFARAVVPARFALEREQWDQAAGLEVAPIAAWESYPFVRGLVEYARAIGAGRSGDAKGARVAVEKLRAIEEKIAPGPAGYIKSLLGAYRLASLGWAEHVEKQDSQALKHLTEAAELEDAIGPHPVSPGPLLPARELLGDLLLELNRPSEARAAYDTNLVHYPGRRRSLEGAMRAATSANDAASARRYAEGLIAVAGPGGGQWVAQARGLLDRPAP
jgi:hypothetical protein